MPSTLKSAFMGARLPSPSTEGEARRIRVDAGVDPIYAQTIAELGT